ncbi:MAG TPA: hypothetical protein VK475_04980 [Pyrinomonadaceae bacterium]|nr:hypothetical protein [Pyrinomonadaceae bacterium]
MARSAPGALMERGHPVRLSAQRAARLSVLRTLADRDVRAPLPLYAEEKPPATSRKRLSGEL